MNRHFLTGEELSRDALSELLADAATLRGERAQKRFRKELDGYSLALMFEKPSLRTHLSFSLAMQELGGRVVESFSDRRKQEEPGDVARVVDGFCDAIMLRTHAHSVLETMAERSRVPIINGLSDSHHPCQALADLMTLQQAFGRLEGLRLAYLGDGNNVLHSLLLLLPPLGVSMSYACPEGFDPDPAIVARARQRAHGGASIEGGRDPRGVVRGADAVYTDVWTSMGFEAEQAKREAAFQGYCLDPALFASASPSAIALHCLPMVRGKEIASEVADHPRSAIFRQSENRLHAQKALLRRLLLPGKGA